MRHVCQVFLSIVLKVTVAQNGTYAYGAEQHRTDAARSGTDLRGTLGLHLSALLWSFPVIDLRTYDVPPCPRGRSRDHPGCDGTPVCNNAGLRCATAFDCGGQEDLCRRCVGSPQQVGIFRLGEESSTLRILAGTS